MPACGTFRPDQRARRGGIDSPYHAERTAASHGPCLGSRHSAVGPTSGLIQRSKLIRSSNPVGCCLADWPAWPLYGGDHVVLVIARELQENCELPPGEIKGVKRVR